MEFTDILTAINTVGFPIVAFCGLFWLYTKMLPVLTELSANMKDMKESVDTMKDTLNLVNQNFVNIFARLAALEAESDKTKDGKHVS